MSRPNLIVVRAGDKSLHPQWLHADRSWDLCVSYYGDYPERYKGQYDFLHCCKGSKWQGLSHFLLAHCDMIARYEYVWFPDDDLFATHETINNFFHLTKQLDLTISQPALTEYSFYGWEITLRKAQCAARLTDFVEIMAPCFKVQDFEHFKSTFAENSSGFGLEWLWKKIAADHQIMRFGIIDATPVFHTRKVGSAGHGGSVSSPRREMIDLLQRHELQATMPKTLQEIKFRN